MNLHTACEVSANCPCEMIRFRRNSTYFVTRIQIAHIIQPYHNADTRMSKRKRQTIKRKNESNLWSLKQIHSTTLESHLDRAEEERFQNVFLLHLLCLFMCCVIIARIYGDYYSISSNTHT